MRSDNTIRGPIRLAAVLVIVAASAGCAAGSAPVGSRPVVSDAPATAVAGSPAGGGAVVAGTFKAGRAQLTLTGARSGSVDMPNLAGAFGASGTTGTGPGYKWYEEGEDGVAVSIRFPSDPVSSGPTTSLPSGTGIQVEFDLLATAGDLFSSSNGECTLSFDQNDATALRGRLECHGVPASQDPTKTVDATGTFEAQP